MLVLPACINNINQGRSYRAFEKMDLDKYLETDKAFRHNCIVKNSNFDIITRYINNQIRNGSHHGDMRFNYKTGNITYRPNRNGSLKYIKYADYLTLSLGIKGTICGLLCVALILEHHQIPPT